MVGMLSWCFPAEVCESFLSWKPPISRKISWSLWFMQMISCKSWSSTVLFPLFFPSLPSQAGQSATPRRLDPIVRQSVVESGGQKLKRLTEIPQTGRQDCTEDTPIVLQGLNMLYCSGFEGALRILLKGFSKPLRVAYSNLLRTVSLCIRVWATHQLWFQPCIWNI